MIDDSVYSTLLDVLISEGDYLPDYIFSCIAIKACAECASEGGCLVL